MQKKRAKIVKVSICLMTYNHENYIDQAIQSVLMQRVDFDIEIIIGEDFSTDRTRAIISEYQERYPEKINPIFRPNNIGMKENFIDTLAHCKGEYVAVLSGDDYWIDPYKLQKQADFLDENSDYVLIGHNAIVVDEVKGSSATLVRHNTNSYDVSTKDLMIKNHFSASEVMFRNFLVTEFPDVYYLSTGEDRRLYLLLSRFGKCRVSCDITGVYRKHSNSITGSRNTNEKKLDALIEQIENAKNWNQYFEGKYTEEFEQVRSHQSMKIVKFAWKHFMFKKALKFAPHVQINESMTLKSKVSFKILQLLSLLINSHD